MRNKVISNYLVLLVLAVVSLVGCKQDEWSASSEAQEQVAINLMLPNVTFTRAGDAITDETVSRVRVFAFDRNDRGRCKLNQFVKTPTDPFWFHLSTGSYDFYFVVNEPLAVGEEDTGGNAALTAVGSYADLANFHVATSNLIGADGLYVMLGSQTNVKVEANYNRPTEDGHPGAYHYHAMVSYTPAVDAAVVRGDKLNIVVERLAVKVNVRLKKGTEVNVEDVFGDGKVTHVKVTGLPASVPMLPGVVSAQPANSEATLALRTIGIAPNDYQGYTAIIPAYHFVPSNVKDRAAKLEVQLWDEATPRTMAIGHDIVDPDYDYTLHRNTIYHIIGKLKSSLVLDITVLPWNEHALDEVVGKYMTIDPITQADIPVGGGTYEVNVTSNDVQWTASSTISGVTITPSSGTKSMAVSISVPANSNVERDIPVVFTGKIGTEIYTTATWQGKQKDHGNSIIPKEKFANTFYGWAALPRDVQIAMRGSKQVPVTGTPSDDPTLWWKNTQTLTPNVETSPNAAQGHAPGGGKNNTDIMVAAGGHPAAEYCRSMGPEWFLPSLKELEVIARYNSMLGESYKLNAPPSQIYWSSSQKNANDAYIVNYKGSTNFFFKDITTTTVAVRCVRYVN